MAQRVVWDTGSRDPATKLPLAVVDCSQLHGQYPEIASIPEFLPALPEGNCALLVMAGTAPSTPNVPWLLRAHKSLPKPVKKRIRRVYIVHGPWWAKALSSIVAISPKFSGKTVHIKSLSELAQHIDITTLPLSLDCWLHDLKVSPDGIIVPRQFDPVFGIDLTRSTSDLWSDSLAFLSSLPDFPAEALQRTNGTPEAAKVFILRQAFERHQAIDLTEFGPRAVLALLKMYMLELPSPLIDIGSLTLPIEDTKEYMNSMFGSLQAPQVLHLTQLMNWVVLAQESTDINAIIESVAPAVTGTVQVHGDDVRISRRIVRNLAVHWPVTIDRIGLRTVSNENLPDIRQRRRKISGPRVAELVECYEPSTTVTNPSVLN